MCKAKESKIHHHRTVIKDYVDCNGIFWQIIGIDQRRKISSYLIYDTIQIISEMVLVDKRMLVGGLVMIIVGIILTVNINATMPVGQTGMTEEEAIDLMIAQQENQDYTTLSGILIGIGFLLVLISFGARRRKGNVQKEEKKPAE